MSAFVAPPGSCPEAEARLGFWLWAAQGLGTKFPSLPALISLSPMRSMHERFPWRSFFKSRGWVPADDPGRPERAEEGLDILPAGLCGALVSYSRTRTPLSLAWHLRFGALLSFVQSPAGFPPPPLQFVRSVCPSVSFSRCLRSGGFLCHTLLPHILDEGLAAENELPPKCFHSQIVLACFLLARSVRANSSVSQSCSASHLSCF